MKKIGKKFSTFFLHEGGGEGSFVTLVLTKLVTLKSDKKLRVSEVRNCNAD
jgi:hypothetical protein